MVYMGSAGFILSTVVPFCGLYLGLYRVIPKRNYHGVLWVSTMIRCIDLNEGALTWHQGS